LARRWAVVVAAAICLCIPALARANGDPASDYLLTQKAYLPFTTKLDQSAAKRLNTLLVNAAKEGFPIRVAVILSPADLGTAFALFGKPQKYAQFLGLELAFVYRDRLLVVMPSGYGYAVKGDPRPQAGVVLKKLSAPGRDPTKEVEGAIAAVQQLAAASGHKLVAPKNSTDSAARDRLVIAAAATAAIAAIAGLVLYRRRKQVEG
jgi:hypothetical protein